MVDRNTSRRSRRSYILNDASGENLSSSNSTSRVLGLDRSRPSTLELDRARHVTSDRILYEENIIYRPTDSLEHQFTTNYVQSPIPTLRSFIDEEEKVIFEAPFEITPLYDMYEHLQQTPTEYRHVAVADANTQATKSTFSYTMKPLYIVIFMLIAFLFGILFILLLHDVHEENFIIEDTMQYKVGIWFQTIGDLYMNMMNCVALPMAFCQVVVSVQELAVKHTLWRVWKKTALMFFVITITSILVSMQIAHAFKTLYTVKTIDSFHIQHTNLSFECAGMNTYVHMKEDSTLACDGTKEDKRNTSFPHLIDPNRVFQFDEAVGDVTISEYIFAVLDIYFPSNIIWSFGKDMYVSVLIVAAVLGVGIAECFRTLAPQHNPLLRLLTHLYQTLFTMLVWLQSIIFLAIFPLVIGPMLKDPKAWNTIESAAYYCIAFFLCAFMQVGVIVPLIYFIVTKKNPLVWLQKNLPPILYAWVVQSSFLPLSSATMSVLDTNEVPSAIFGSVYPILAALNRCSSALGLPSSLVWAAASSGCPVVPKYKHFFSLISMCFFASLGDTAIPRSRLALFLTMWRILCPNNRTPASVLAITGVEFITYRLTALCDTITNLMILRIVAHLEANITTDSPPQQDQSTNNIYWTEYQLYDS